MITPNLNLLSSRDLGIYEAISKNTYTQTYEQNKPQANVLIVKCACLGLRKNCIGLVPESSETPSIEVTTVHSKNVDSF